MKHDPTEYRRQIVRRALKDRADALMTELGEQFDHVGPDVSDEEWLTGMSPIVAHMNDLREIYDMLVAKP